MSSSSSPAIATEQWAPKLDLTTPGLKAYDPERVVESIARGREAGYQAGFAAAQADARRIAEQAAAEAQRLLDAIANGAQRLANEDSQAKDIFIEHVVDLAMDLATAIVHRELRDEHHAATEALRRAMAPLDIGATATVRMHPLDCDRLGEITMPEGVRLVPDQSIEPGDAIATTSSQTVDARIGTAIDRARTALGLA